MGRYGPLVCQVLVHKIAGEASRSELDVLAEPLRKIIFYQQSAKAWLSDALNSDTFPSQKVNQMEKRIWLIKIMRCGIAILEYHLVWANRVLAFAEPLERIQRYETSGSNVEALNSPILHKSGIVICIKSGRSHHR